MRTCRTEAIRAGMSSGRLLWCAVIWSGIGAAALPPVVAAGPRAASFQGLGNVSQQWFESQAYGVSADGSAVTGWSYSGDEFGYLTWEAFLWTPGSGIEGLGFLEGGPYHRSGANAISADGSAAVGFSISANSMVEAFRWTASTEMQPLGDLEGGSFESQAFGVSGDGSVVVGYGISTNGQEAFRWAAAGGMQGLGDLSGGDYLSNAYGVSADGSVVVGFGTWGAWWADQQEAFRWTAAAGMVGLGHLPGGADSSRGYGVSADGSTVVGWSASANSAHEAFRWTASTGMHGLGDLPGGLFDSWALAASGDGAIIVGTSLSDAPNGNEAFIWDAAHGMRKLKTVLQADYGLDLTGWTPEMAYAISADGRAIAGWGWNPDGWREAWLAVMPPILRGDVDCDGGVGFGDINPFVLLLSDPELWQQTYPECPIRNGDINADGVVDFADINPFVDCVVNGGCTAP